MTEFVAITNQLHTESKTGERSEKSDNSSLTEKNPDDLRDRCAQSLHDSDLPSLLHGDGNQCAHDSERSDHHNKEEEEKHYCALESYRFKKLVIHFNPGFGELRRLEILLD